MDTTFISIHDLSRDARLLYVSNSIGDVLGYHPDEVIGKSCWDYFHPDEIPFAKTLHGRGVELDKAAVLNYCRIMSKEGQYVGCECCFTVVHDVLVGCTSIYRIDPKSQQRAANAPIIRQIFSSSPKDPRCNMLSYISSKFSEGPVPHVREPRAALFLNRFTRTLTIMYATNGLEKLLGISSAELTGKSFYYCIQENCLQEAVNCLERAKANDSIAYLRFWYRDPRSDDNSDPDETMSDVQSSSDEDDGGVNLRPQLDDLSYAAGGSRDTAHSSVSSMSISSGQAGFTPLGGTGGVPVPHITDSTSGLSSNFLSGTTDYGHLDPIFDRDRMVTESSGTSVSPGGQQHRATDEGMGSNPPSIELEAVVSCTSDGLVVVLRSARPFVPDSVRQAPNAPRPTYANGLFASPWASDPGPPVGASSIGPSPRSPTLSSTESSVAMAASSLAMPDLMKTIRDAAVFAWALTGINGSLAQYSRGAPAAGAQPFGGLPVHSDDAGQIVDGDIMID